MNMEIDEEMTVQIDKFVSENNDDRKILLDKVYLSEIPFKKFYRIKFYSTEFIDNEILHSSYEVANFFFDKLCDSIKYDDMPYIE